MAGKLQYRDERQFHYSSGEDDGAFSGVDSSSDDDDETPWKRQKSNNFAQIKGDDKPLNQPNNKTHKSSVESIDGKECRKSKASNKVWTAVLQGQEEQEVELHLNNIDMDPSAVVTERDVESYKFKRTSDSQRQGEYKEHSQYRDNRHTHRRREYRDDDHHHHHHHYNRQHRQGKRKRGVKERLGRPNVKERLGKPNVRDRLGNRTDYYDIPITVNEDHDPETVAQEIIKRLQEEKEDLIRKIVEVVGNKKALQLLRETEEVEHTGGMMTQDGSRRRQPGGVYLTILKSDVDISKEQLGAINEFSRKMESENKKKAEKRRRYLQAKRFKQKLKEEKNTKKEMIDVKMEPVETSTNVNATESGNSETALDKVSENVGEEGEIID